LSLALVAVIWQLLFTLHGNFHASNLRRWSVALTAVTKFAKRARDSTLDAWRNDVAFGCTPEPPEIQPPRVLSKFSQMSISDMLHIRGILSRLCNSDESVRKPHA
jgi:hypothetical protein